MQLSYYQLDKLSTLFLNLAQGAFLTVLALSLFANQYELLNAVKSLVLGIFFTYLTLKAEQRKGVKLVNDIIG